MELSRTDIDVLQVVVSQLDDAANRDDITQGVASYLRETACLMGARFSLPIPLHPAQPQTPAHTCEVVPLSRAREARAQ